MDIGYDAISDAVAELFAEGGYDAVSIADTAAKLSISRSTLYRTLPTKSDLLGILFERSTRRLTEQVSELEERHRDEPAEQFRALVRLQIHTATEMRGYLPVFFGGPDLPPDVYQRWRQFSRDFEQRWTEVVRTAMNAGVLEPADPILATRLLLGMCLWISYWHGPESPYEGDDIANVVISLLRHDLVPDAAR